MESTIRNTLRLAITSCRRLLEGDYLLQLEGRYGVRADGRMEPLESLAHLDASGLADRRSIEAALQHEQLQEGDLPQAITRFVRESAFTALNRLAALKLMENPARKLIAESVGRKDQSRGFRQFVMISPEALRDKPDGGYGLYLQLLIGDLSPTLGMLFDLSMPQSILFPSQTCLDEVLDLLNQPELESVWPQDETVGWIYQYFTPPELRDQVRKESSAPRNSNELAFRNQFFTPRYVVEFLTDNSLGRLWYEMTRGETILKDTCSYMVHRQREIFLGHPNLSHENAPAWVKTILEKADFSVMPEAPSIDEMGDLALLIDGYAVVEQLGYGEGLDFASDCLRAQANGQPLPTDSLELWLILFAHQRSAIRHGLAGPEEESPTQQSIRMVYNALRQALQNPPADLSQQEVLRQPVYIPQRKPKDPREIKMLDPACGSMHFGLYAFDLFETIYVEAWQRRFIPQVDFGYREKPEIVLDTVTLKRDGSAESNYSQKTIPIENTYVVMTRMGDGGDGVRPDDLYIVDEQKHFRVPFDLRVRLRDFDLQAAIRTGLLNSAKADDWVRQAGCFDYVELPAMSEAEAFENYRREIPRLILEHNIHGIDIDLRAVQISSLALWLRAQRAYNELKIPLRQRKFNLVPQIVCAEPMPGEYDLLGEYLRDLKPAILGNLVREIWERMKNADEIGGLLRIDQEIRAAITRARLVWQNAPQGAQLSLFGERSAAVQLKMDLAEIKDEAFWERAEQEALRELERYVRGSGLVTRQLFSHDAIQGFAFVNLLLKSFDVVLMNPPFGAPSLGSKDYIIQNYPRTKNDLYAAFVERGLELLVPGGYLGAISSRTGFFLKSFQAWREEILLQEAQVIALADLGYGVLDTAMVETAAYVVQKLPEQQ